MTETRKYVIIIGAMKSGTTTLFDMLARHPQIVPSANKEPGFFAFDEIWSQGFEWFDTLFEFDPQQHVYRLEASTDYTKAPFVTGVWERMSQRPDLDIRLLYIMRHPLQRIESHARHVQRARKEIGQHISPKTDFGLDEGLSLLNIATSCYAAQLDRYRQAWEAGRLHCLTLEDLRQDPEMTMAAIWDFLALPPPKTVDVLRSNAAGTRSNAHPIWVQLARSRSLMAVGRTILPVSAREKVKGVFQQKAKQEGRFTLSPAEQAALMDILGPDLERLKSLYNVHPPAPWTILP